MDLAAHRRVRVTARSRRNERFPVETLRSIPRWQHPFQIADPNWHRSEPLHLRVRMEAGRVGGCEVQGGQPEQAPPVGRRSAVRVTRPRKPLLTRGGLLMEAATVRERSSAGAGRRTDSAWLATSRSKATRGSIGTLGRVLL
jgi:hypothetical protein